MCLCTRCTRTHIALVLKAWEPPHPAGHTARRWHQFTQGAQLPCPRMPARMNVCVTSPLRGRYLCAPRVGAEYGTKPPLPGRVPGRKRRWRPLVRRLLLLPDNRSLHSGATENACYNRQSVAVPPKAQDPNTAVTWSPGGSGHRFILFSNRHFVSQTRNTSDRFQHCNSDI